MRRRLRALSNRVCSPLDRKNRRFLSSLRTPDRCIDDWNLLRSCSPPSPSRIVTNAKSQPSVNCCRPSIAAKSDLAPVPVLAQLIVLWQPLATLGMRLSGCRWLCAGVSACACRPADQAADSVCERAYISFPGASYNWLSCRGVQMLYLTKVREEDMNIPHKPRCILLHYLASVGSRCQEALQASDGRQDTGPCWTCQYRRRLSWG